ncbi:MAG TPA: PIN domain-containing protein [Thermomicrobiales bacterium]|nr:PIN domain-containing protein [Thermomicrobiales bacterium]
MATNQHLATEDLVATDSHVDGRTSEPVAFVDSSAIVALVDRNDTTHDAAIAAYRDLIDQGYKLFTTNYVQAETVSLLADGLGPEIASQWLRDHRLPIYHADEQDEHRARALVIASRSPRGLSYVDAISLVVMERLGVADAFAVDPHFLSETS